MAITAIKLNPKLYIDTPISPQDGARIVYEKMTLLTADVVSTQMIALAVLPAGARLMNAAYETADLDSGASLTVSVGILNTYYGQAPATAAVPAAYSSGGATDVGTAPALVSGQNIFTSITTGQSAARNSNPILAFTDAIGVDTAKDRIVGVQVMTDPNTAQTGSIGIILTIDAA